MLNRRAALVLVPLASAACFEDADLGTVLRRDDQGTRGEPWPSADGGTLTLVASPPEQGPSSTPPRPVPEVDLCDEDAFEGVAWSEADRGHFRFHFLPATEAERDLETIAANREDAYADIRLALGVDATPTVDVWLSPNRVAADWHGKSTGRAWPGRDRYEVIYTGEPYSYETVHYGHELAHVLSYYILPDGTYHLPVLSEGVAEYLDQSGRDLHQAYAEQLNGGLEARTHMVSFESSDVAGDNYGRSGSLVQALAEMYGFDTVVALSEYTAVGWDSGCYWHQDVGCVDSPEAIDELLDTGLRAVASSDLTEFRSGWRARVEAAMASATELQGRQRQEVEEILRYSDAAIDAEDPTAYRAVMDGFYCDWADEGERERIAERMVDAFDEVQTQALAIYPTGTTNYPTAQALVSRTDEFGAVSTLDISMERFPVGWRINWTTDWK